MRQVDYQHLWHINVWCGILSLQIVGFYFFKRALNEEVYEHSSAVLGERALKCNNKHVVSAPWLPNSVCLNILLSLSIDREEWANKLAIKIPRPQSHGLLHGIKKNKLCFKTNEKEYEKHGRKFKKNYRLIYFYFQAEFAETFYQENFIF